MKTINALIMLFGLITVFIIISPYAFSGYSAAENARFRTLMGLPSQYDRSPEVLTERMSGWLRLAKVTVKVNVWFVAIGLIWVLIGFILSVKRMTRKLLCLFVCITVIGSLQPLNAQPESVFNS